MSELSSMPRTIAFDLPSEAFPFTWSVYATDGRLLHEETVPSAGATRIPAFTSPPPAMVRFDFADGIEEVYVL